jgi:maltose O-acetyltransferase
VQIEDNVVIGGGATLIAGITLSSGCIIGAGAVLTKSVASDEVWFGNPATLKMNRDEYEARRD